MSQYKSSHQLITVICKTCLNQNTAKACSFLKRKNNCSYCHHKHKLTNNEYKSKIYNKPIIIIDEYNGLKCKTKHQCIKCKYIYGFRTFILKNYN